MAKTFIGFDVNSTEAKVVHPNGSAYFEQTPANYFDEDGDLSTEAMGEFLKSFKSNSGISGNSCAVVLPETATYYRSINCPVMSDEQVKLNLPFEFKNYVGAETSKYNYDYFVDSIEEDAEGKPLSMNLIAAAGLKSVIDGYDIALNKAGLKLGLALPKEICLINLMKAKAKEDKEYCLIGVGYEYTNVYMFKGSKLVATKAIDIGNREIDTVIVNELRLEEHEAPLYREINKGNCLNKKALKTVYERIALEVMKTVNFYKYENGDSKVNTVYFFDMGAENELLNKTICKEIGFKQGDVNDLLPDEFVGREDASRCLVGIGLVL